MPSVQLPRLPINPQPIKLKTNQWVPLPSRGIQAQFINTHIRSRVIKAQLDNTHFQMQFKDSYQLVKVLCMRIPVQPFQNQTKTVRLVLYQVQTETARLVPLLRLRSKDQLRYLYHHFRIFKRNFELVQKNCSVHEKKKPKRVSVFFSGAH
jgi:hypothetical protein